MGFSAADFAEQVLGIALIPWQRWLLIHAMELADDARFRYRTVVILVARQNGKTTIVEVKNLWKMFVLRVPLVIGTAQNLDISEESWDKAVEIVEGIPELSAEVEHVDRTNGKKALRLSNGSRWKIAAASRKGGRGLSGDDVNLDELREHHTWESWAAVTKTTMARRNSQVFAFSNAGDDRSVVLNELQEKGRVAAADSDADPALGLFEWSAPDDCPIDDPQFWAMANPSLGYTITEDALRSALATDPEGIFRTECLCQRVQDLVGTWQVISEPAWVARTDVASKGVGALAFAIDVTPDRRWAAIAAAGGRGDGGVHLELVEHGPGTGWVASRMRELVDKWKPCAVILDAAGPAGSLIAPLEAAGIDLEIPSAREIGQACGQFFDGICGETPSMWHLGELELATALAGAQKRPLGDAWAWARKHVTVDISPLVAVTLASWGFATKGHQQRAPLKPLFAWK